MYIYLMEKNAHMNTNRNQHSMFDEIELRFSQFL